MARMSVTGVAGMITDMSGLDDDLDDVVADILNAEADVIVQAQREEIARKWKGPYSMGISAESVKKDSKVRGLGLGKFYRYINVYPQGTRKRGGKSISNAEIAFINEYGAPKRGIAARPAIRTANAKSAGKAVEAGERVYHAYLDSKNL